MRQRSFSLFNSNQDAGRAFSRALVSYSDSRVRATGIRRKTKKVRRTEKNSPGSGLLFRRDVSRALNFSAAMPHVRSLRFDRSNTPLFSANLCASSLDAPPFPCPPPPRRLASLVLASRFSPALHYWFNYNFSRRLDAFFFWRGDASETLRGFWRQREKYRAF